MTQKDQSSEKSSMILWLFMGCFLILGMVVVGGDEWTSAFGASAITNESIFKTEKLDKIFLQKWIFTWPTCCYNC